MNSHSSLLSAPSLPTTGASQGNIGGVGNSILNGTRNLRDHTSRLSQRVQAVPPSGIRRYFDIAATMDDELDLKAGQLVRMLHEYDDGWVS